MNVHTYKVINGTSYDSRTSQNVINALEYARQNDLRIRIYFGDVATGKAWNEEHGIAGYIGRSTGENKVPLLISNSRSHGGSHLLDHCIVKIKESKGNRVIYQAANFIAPFTEVRQSIAPGYTHSVYINGELYSNHKTEKAALLLAKKMA